jgi:hypothetical protein
LRVIGGSRASWRAPAQVAHPKGFEPMASAFGGQFLWFVTHCSDLRYSHIPLDLPHFIFVTFRIWLLGFAKMW